MDKGRHADELKSFTFAGYFVARVTRSYRKSPVLPDAILTVSTCVTDTLPNAWALEWVPQSDQERIKAARKCDFPETRLADFVKWVTAGFDAGRIGWPNVIFSMQTAADMFKKFSINPEEWRILALGLKTNQLDKFLAVPDSPQEALGVGGVYTAVRQRRGFESGGDILGYDVLGMEASGDFHSWFCNLLEEEVARDLGVSPGPLGLLPTYSQAEACAQYASRPGSPAEPVPWYPWVVVEYRLPA